MRFRGVVTEGHTKKKPRARQNAVGLSPFGFAPLQVTHFARVTLLEPFQKIRIVGGRGGRRGAGQLKPKFQGLGLELLGAFEGAYHSKELSVSPTALMRVSATTAKDKTCRLAGR